MGDISSENEAIASVLRLTSSISDIALRTEVRRNLEIIAKAAVLRKQKLGYERRARLLVGAMVPIGDAAKYSRMAQASSRSMTKFCRDAFDAEYERVLSDFTEEK